MALENITDEESKKLVVRDLESSKSYGMPWYKKAFVTGLMLAGLSSGVYGNLRVRGSDGQFKPVAGSSYNSERELLDVILRKYGTAQIREMREEKKKINKKFNTYLIFTSINLKKGGSVLSYDDLFKLVRSPQDYIINLFSEKLYLDEYKAREDIEKFKKETGYDKEMYLLKVRYGADEKEEIKSVLDDKGNVMS